jgi:hypothetical protein
VLAALGVAEARPERRIPGRGFPYPHKGATPRICEGMMERSLWQMEQHM